MAWLTSSHTREPWGDQEGPRTPEATVTLPDARMDLFLLLPILVRVGLLSRRAGVFVACDGS